MRLLSALLITAAPALAEEALLDPVAPAQPGAVALYLQAQGLADLGRTAKDPLLVATAARLLHGLTLTLADRRPEPPSKAATHLPAPDAATLLDEARRLDAGQNYSDLIDMLAREVPPQPRALRVSASTLQPGQVEVWTLAFFGATYSELAILGDGRGNLDLFVAGAGDTVICQDRGSADVALCGFVLVENGEVTVTVSNAGAVADSYLLLTE